MPRGVYDRTINPRFPKVYPPETVALVRTMIEEERRTIADVTRATGYCFRTVRKIMDRHGIERPATVAGLCQNGLHPMEGDNVTGEVGKPRCRACARDRQARYHRRQFTERHAGHEVIVQPNGRHWCVPCGRGEHDIDDIAVERAISGEPPERLRPAERERAIVTLYARNHTKAEIARRVGSHLPTVRRILSRLNITDPEDARAWLRPQEVAA